MKTYLLLPLYTFRSKTIYHLYRRTANRFLYHFIRQLYPLPSISASLYHIHSLNQSMDSTGFSLKTSPCAEMPRKSLQPASFFPPRSPSESARALLMRSVKSAFALLLTRVTEPRQPSLAQERRLREKNHLRHARQRLIVAQQPSIHR